MSSNYKKSRKDKTTVLIEEVDESWALVLLNESEKEDGVIKIESEPNRRDFYSKDLCLIQSTKRKDSGDEYIKVNSNRQTESPSAIENQIQAQKWLNKHPENSIKEQKPNSSFSRIKRFFIA